MNLLLFLGILLAIYLVFKYYNFGSVKEGLEGDSTTTTSTNGIASNAQTYDNTLQQKNNTFKDTLNIATYRQNYEDIILHLDELIQYNLLNNILTTDMSKENAITTTAYYLSYHSGARTALNNLLKFVDKK